MFMFCTHTTATHMTFSVTGHGTLMHPHWLHSTQAAQHAHRPGPSSSGARRTWLPTCLRLDLRQHALFSTMQVMMPVPHGTRGPWASHDCWVGDGAGCGERWCGCGAGAGAGGLGDGAGGAPPLESCITAARPAKHATNPNREMMATLVT